MNVVKYILRYMKVASRKRILFTKNADCQNINDTNSKG